MLDMCFAPNRWKNSVFNVRAAPQISLNSDHALLLIDFGARLANTEKKRIDKVPRYKPPTQEQKEAYSQAIKDKRISIAD